MANGNARVNATRAEIQGCLAVDRTLAAATPPLATAVTAAETSRAKTAVKDLDTSGRREAVQVNVFVQSVKPLAGAPVRRAFGRLSTMRLPLEDVVNLAF